MKYSIRGEVLSRDNDLDIISVGNRNFTECFLWNNGANLSHVSKNIKSVSDLSMFKRQSGTSVSKQVHGEGSKREHSNYGQREKDMVPAAHCYYSFFFIQEI